MIAVKMQSILRRLNMSKRGENITKRKDGRWEARYIKYYEDGKAVYGYLYGKTYSEAKKKKENALRDKAEASTQRRTELFNDLINYFLLQKKYCVKESTYAHYCNLVDRHIRNELGSVQLCDLTAYTIEQYADQKLRNGKADMMGGLSPKTVKDILTLIKSILKYGIAKELLPSNILTFSTPKVQKKDIEILSLTDQKRLEQGTFNEDNLHFGIYLCLYTGMRIGEVCALQWKDIDLINYTININKTIQRVSNCEANSSAKTKVIIDTPKSIASKRAIPIPALLCEQLSQRRQENCSDACFFLTGSNRYIEPRNYYARYQDILLDCGIAQYTFHALRHTFATRCIEIGFDPKVLSEILGHTDVKITLDRYVHPSIDRKRACMELLYAN